MATSLEQLRAAQTRSDLANLLKIETRSLTYQLYKIQPSQRYRSFSIPKKSGGERIINAPNDRLKHIQAQLSELLYKCLSEIESESPNRKTVAHGFFKTRGILSNALPHVGKRYVLNMDLQNFFGEINFGRVRGYFLKDRNFQLNPDVATTIAQIACHDNQLPQGSPSSPIISNLILRMVDVRLASLSSDNDVYYTRYADDLTFSTNKRTFPRRLARRRLFKKSAWVLSKRLRDEIHAAGFEINRSKTRMQITGSRQEVTGLIVNKKVNVDQRYYRVTRSMCNSLFCHGFYHDPKVPPEARNKTNQIKSLAPLEGRLGHIYFIKARRDRTEDDQRRLLNSHEFIAPIAMTKLYRKYLFFKHFVANPRPIIFTEGKTDVVYLKCAIRARRTHFPALVDDSSGSPQSLVSFVKPSKINAKLMNGGSGSGGFPALIKNYQTEMSRFPFAPQTNPVIIFVDNDDGGRSAIAAAKEVSKKAISLSNPQLWHHICGNLYLLKTPIATTAPYHSCAEDLFPLDVLATKVAGKAFNPRKNMDPNKEYGKHIFSDQVVRHVSDPTKFSMFDPVLQALTEIISDHKSKV